MLFYITCLLILAEQSKLYIAVHRNYNNYFSVSKTEIYGNCEKRKKDKKKTNFKY